MYSVCIHYDNCGQAFSTEMGNCQWAYLFLHFTPDKIYIVQDETNQKGIGELLKEEVFTYVPTKLISDYSEISENLIFMTPKNAQHVKGDKDLTTYRHANNVCYIFGKNENHLQTDLEGDKVYIDAGDVPMFNWCAAAITLYDRKFKNGDRR